MAPNGDHRLVAIPHGLNPLLTTRAGSTPQASSTWGVSLAAVDPPRCPQRGQPVAAVRRQSTCVAAVCRSNVSQPNNTRCLFPRLGAPPPPTSSGLTRLQLVDHLAADCCHAAASPTDVESAGSTCTVSTCEPPEMEPRDSLDLPAVGGATSEQASTDDGSRSMGPGGDAPAPTVVDSQGAAGHENTIGVDFPHASLEDLGYDVTGDIEEGRHGVVHLARHKATGDLRCLKCYDKEGMRADSMALLKAEVGFMFFLGRHPKIVDAIEIFQDCDSYFLSMPYYNGGTLVDLKGKASEAGVVPTEQWWRGIFSQCLEGLAHMHANGVIHCDIKEPNIMLRTGDLREPDIVIIDLGVAQPVGAQRSVIFGTPGYIPPEVWEGKNWYPQSDMFSLGVVVVQTLIRKVGVFTENTRTYREMKEATQKRTPPFQLMPMEFPSLQGLAQRLLVKDFPMRPTAAAMLEESWEIGVNRRWANAEQMP